MAYFDHNATTPLDGRVLEAMLPYLAEHFGNPSALYRRGRLARHAVEAAREQIAGLVGVESRQVIFTSGGTEANNLALTGVPGRHGRVAVSAVEHASVLDCALARFGEHGLQVMAVDEQGRVKPEVLDQALESGVDLVSVMAANNETGVIQDVATLAERAHASGTLFHTDAVQAAGKAALNFDSSGVDLMTLSSHKIYGPKGVGALVVGKHIELSPLLVGGGQERGLRSGTENVAAIVGFGLAAESAAAEWEERRRHTLGLRTYLEQRLAAMQGISVFGAEAERLPNTVFMAMPGMDGETLLMALDRVGIEVAGGSACHSQKTTPSHVLLAMGVDEELARCAIRISFGRDNTRADVDVLADELERQLSQLHSADLLSWS